MIYIHIPFCHRKCTYCAFYSTPRAAGSMERYVDALIVEMEQRCAEQPHPIQTIYFGGGTPSMLLIGLLQRLVEALRTHFDLSQLQEATIECNPEDLTPTYLSALQSLGLFNRLSIGVQSLDDTTLRLIGRRHTASQALAAVEAAAMVGFDNVSVDFIYGLPGSEGTDFAALAQVLALPQVKHVSAYALTVEEGTALSVQLKQGRMSLPGEDEVVRQYFALHERLVDEGFCQYEVSNYCRPGYPSRHNSRYWDRTPYLGLGAAAHSFDGRRRRWNVADVERYISTHTFEEEVLTERDAYNELLMTALRTTRGLDVASVPEQYRAALLSGIQRYVDCGWLSVNNQHIAPTAEGLLHADGIAASLFV